MNTLHYSRMYDKKKYNLIEIDLTEVINPKAKVQPEDTNIIIIQDIIENISDLIRVAKKYSTEKKYNINIKILRKLIEPLSKLDKMIGIEHVKELVFDQLLYFIQIKHNYNDVMLHTVIKGPPGCGKTQFAQILSEIYKNLGILSKGHFTSVKRSQLIGNHLGETAMKTQHILNECKGGILFIDEAYSIGSTDNKDTYSKECIDTITSFLTEEKNDFILIIAGYENDLDKYIFANNQGLDRRFNWIYVLNNYTYIDLKKIFIQKIHNNKWCINDNIELDMFFKTNYKYFKNFGGDMDTLLCKTKLSFLKRNLKCINETRLININDLNNASVFFKSKNLNIFNDKNMMYC